MLQKEKEEIQATNRNKIRNNINKEKNKKDENNDDNYTEYNITDIAGKNAKKNK